MRTRCPPAPPPAPLALALAALLTACGDHAGGGGNDAPLADAPAADAAIPDAPAPDAGYPPLRPCTAGAVTIPGCFALTPAESGLRPDGTNASVEQFALRPASGAARGKLLVFLNGSGGAPRAGFVTATGGWYQSARATGLHVLGVAYRSDDAVGNLCTGPGRDACFVPTRTSILTGVPQPGAAPGLTGLTPDEGVYARIAAALRDLDAGDPAGGWGAFLQAAPPDAPEQAIRWADVLVSGHSQGGGHAALIGRTHPVERVLMLASPCDATAAGVASWLAGTGFATPPATRYLGLGAPGDSVCPTYAAAWAALGMPTSASDAGATVCAGEGAHGAPLRCAENAPRWATMLQ